MAKDAVHICGPKIYRYDGVLFEVHSYFGPWPLRQDGAPKAGLAGAAFWSMWDRFSELTAEQQERYRIG